MTPNIPRIPLSDGSSIPQLGFGTWQISPADAEAAVRAALDAGYRHIDTAQLYGNEAEVGKAIRASGVPREEIYLTTKLANSRHAPAEVRAATEESLAALDCGWIDLYLVHWPLPMHGDVAEVWDAMVGVRDGERVRGIGVSNFQPAHLDRLDEAGLPRPLVNQVEVNPFFANEAVRERNRAAGIATQAWSPLGQGKAATDPVLAAIAAETGKSFAQVVLRWTLQRGDIVFPKSTTPARIRENLDVFDFSLTHEQMRRIDALDRGERSGPDPDVFDWLG